MRSSTRTGLMLLQLIIAVAAQGAPRPRQDIGMILEGRVTSYDLGEQNLVGGLVRASSEFHVPIGITWIDSSRTRATFKFAWKQTNVRRVIQDIVKSYPEYRLQELNGIVHVFPLTIPDQQNFLKLSVGPFELHSTVEVGFWKLHTLLGPRNSGSFAVSIAGPADEPNIDVDMKNSTVEGILDELAVVSTRKVWIVTFVGDQRLSRGGLRRSISLWSQKATTDQEIPTWDTLRWGDPDPPGITREKE